jgi:site-specific recombinase XerD
MEDMRLMIIVLSRTGVRFSELKFFTVEKLANRTQISIYNKGKHRQITIPDDVKREINGYIKKYNIESGYIFRAPRNKEKPLGLSTAWERFQRIAGHAKISLNKAHAHSFRHLFTKKLISEGNSIELVADILGHSSTETTRGYARLNDVEMKDVMNSVHYKKRRGRKKNENE